MFIFDFGQNFAGGARLHVKGTRGTCVRLRYGELLFPDGTLDGMTAVAGQIKGGGKNYIYDGRGEPKPLSNWINTPSKALAPKPMRPGLLFMASAMSKSPDFPASPHWTRSRVSA